MTPADTRPSTPLAVSVDEAGKLLGVSRDLIYDMVARDEIGYIRMGRRILIPRVALEALVEGAKPGCAADNAS